MPATTDAPEIEQGATLETHTPNTPQDAVGIRARVGGEVASTPYTLPMASSKPVGKKGGTRTMLDANDKGLTETSDGRLRYADTDSDYDETTEVPPPSDELIAKYDCDMFGDIDPGVQSMWDVAEANTYKSLTVTSKDGETLSRLIRRFRDPIHPDHLEPRLVMQPFFPEDSLIRGDGSPRTRRVPGGVAQGPYPNRP